MTLMRGIYSLALAGALGLIAVSASAETRDRPWGGGGFSHCYDDNENDSVTPSRYGDGHGHHCPGKLIIKKVTVGGDDDFTFTKKRLKAEASFKSSEDENAHTFTLRNGQTKPILVFRAVTYRIEEINLPSDWSLQSVSCTSEDFNVEGNALYVHVVRGETVVCTFTNFKGHDDPARTATELFVHRRLDNLLTKGPDRARLLRRLKPVEQVESLKDGPIKLAAGEQDQSNDDGAPDQIRGLRGETASQDQIRSGNPLFDGIATQLSSAFGNGNEMRFSASLADLRADAARATARNAARNAQSKGAGFDATPYENAMYVPRSSFDIWVEGRISRYDDDAANLNRDGRFRILYVGADYLIAPGILLGVLAEVDNTVEDLDNGLVGRIDGTGWTAGPYIGIVLGQGIYFDARAAWGTSDNDIDITDAAAGARSGSFETDRWLAKASLTANHYYGAWRLTPQVGIAYGEEEFDTYVTSLGQVVTGDQVHLGQATGEVEVGYTFVTERGTFIEPTLSVEGIWSFDNDDVVVSGVGYGTDESRAKIEAGLNLTDASGLGLRWSAAYDGIGAGDYDAWEGALWINVPLN